MKRIICLLFSCFVLAGCVPIPPIQDASEDVPRAKLRAIVGNEVLIAMLRGFSEGRSMSMIVGGGLGADGRNLGMPNPERIGGQHFTEIYVEAGKPFLLSYYITGCFLDGIFVPEEGKNYEVRAQSLPEIRMCVMGVSVFENGHWTPIPLRKPQVPQ